MPTVAHVIRRRHKRQKRYQAQARRFNLRTSLLFVFPLALALAPLVALLTLSFFLYMQAAAQLPSPQDAFLGYRSTAETRIFDRSGQVELPQLPSARQRTSRWTSLDELPDVVPVAALLLHAPDTGRAKHFSLAQTVQNLWRYIIGHPQQHDKSLSAQLARQSLQPQLAESELDARLLEIAFSAEIRRRHSTAEIVEWWLNSAAFGLDAFGIDAAAQLHFAKPAAQLTDIEALALLLLPERAASYQRAAKLLDELEGRGLLSSARLAAADLQKLKWTAPVTSDEAPGDFSSYAQRQAASILNWHGLNGNWLVVHGGLVIRSSLDMSLQLAAECLLQSHLERLAGKNVAGTCPAAESLPSPAPVSAPPDTAELVLLDVATGEILSFVGDAATALHPPGLLLQPFVYSNGFLRRELTPASMLLDLPRSYPDPVTERDYSPASPDGSYRGPVLLRDAMAAALLPAAVDAASRGDLQSAVQTAQSLGFSSLPQGAVPLDIMQRGGAVSVLDAAYAYQTFAAMGAMRGVDAGALSPSMRARDPVAVLEIVDSRGHVLWAYNHRNPTETQVLQASVAYLVNDILADSQARASTLQAPQPFLDLPGAVAVLDGMSSDNRGSWTLGYSPDFLLALHTSRADAAPMSLDPARRLGSAPVWHTLLNRARTQRSLPPRAWQKPPDIEEFLVCETSGMLPISTEHCPTRREQLPAGSILQRDSLWQTVEINRATGQLATVNTPPADILRQSFFLPPEPALDWWLANDRPMPPGDDTAANPQASQPALQLTAPSDFAYVGATVEIAGRINRPGAQRWRLEYGADVNPSQWTPITESAVTSEPSTITSTWHTAQLNGTYSLRMTGSFADHSQYADTILLTIDNKPPQLALTLRDASANAGRQVLQADASDNLSVERVEFYVDDELLAIDQEFPYGTALPANLQNALLRALAYDRVGNRSVSQLRLGDGGA